MELHSILIWIFYFYQKEIKFKNVICNKLVCNIYDKETVVHIRTLKQALNHRLILKKVKSNSI